MRAAASPGHVVIVGCTRVTLLNLSRRLVDALDAYQRALSFCPGKSEERALLHANRAACYLRGVRNSLVGPVFQRHPVYRFDTLICVRVALRLSAPGPTSPHV